MKISGGRNQKCFRTLCLIILTCKSADLQRKSETRLIKFLVKAGFMFDVFEKRNFTHSNKK